MMMMMISVVTVLDFSFSVGFGLVSVFHPAGWPIQVTSTEFRLQTFV